MLYFIQQDRDAFLKMFQDVVRGDGEFQAVVLVRPHERAAVKLHLLAFPTTSGETTSWLWFLRPCVDDAANLQEKKTRVVPVRNIDAPV